MFHRSEKDMNFGYSDYRGTTVTSKNKNNYMIPTHLLTHGGRVPEKYLRELVQSLLMFSGNDV